MNRAFPGPRSAGALNRHRIAGFCKDQRGLSSLFISLSSSSSPKPHLLHSLGSAFHLFLLPPLFTLSLLSFDLPATPLFSTVDGRTCVRLRIRRHYLVPRFTTDTYDLLRAAAYRTLFHFSLNFDRRKESSTMNYFHFLGWYLTNDSIGEKSIFILISS